MAVGSPTQPSPKPSASITSHSASAARGSDPEGLAACYRKRDTLLVVGSFVHEHRIHGELTLVDYGFSVEGLEDGIAGAQEIEVGVLQPRMDEAFDLASFVARVVEGALVHEEIERFRLAFCEVSAI